MPLKTNSTMKTYQNRSSRGSDGRAPNARKRSVYNSPSRGGSSSAPRRQGRPSFGGHGHSAGRPRRKQSTFDPSQFINKNPSRKDPEVFTPTNTFDTFGLCQELVGALKAQNIHTPTPIQDRVISEVLAGKDVIGLAETGTGKTAAFLLPLIHMTTTKKHRQTLILTPTRELAIQIETELRTFTKGMHLYSTTCVGGAGIGPQIRSLRRENHFIIGTPGRILDLIQRKFIVPEHFTAVVLDEADRMLDMGFIHDLKKILSTTHKEKQTLFFSATMTPAADALVSSFLNDPVRVSVKKREVANSIEQDVVHYDANNKFDTLRDLLQDPSFTRVIVFGSMKHSVERLSQELSESGVRADSIHGNKSHGQRQRSLGAFKNGQVRVLVATDVAARGIHVSDVSHVINYDLPNSMDDYVHRIGRTGRADKQGKALTFVPRPHTHQKERGAMHHRGLK